MNIEAVNPHTGDDNASVMMNNFADNYIVMIMWTYNNGYCRQIIILEGLCSIYLVPTCFIDATCFMRVSSTYVIIWKYIL